MNIYCGLRSRVSILTQGDPVNNVSKNASAPSNSANELRPEFAHKITVFIGSEENRAADIPDLSLHRRIAPTASCSWTPRQSPTEPQAAPGPWPLVPPSAAGEDLRCAHLCS